MKFKSLMIIKSAVCLGFAPPMLFPGLAARAFRAGVRNGRGPDRPGIRAALGRQHAPGLAGPECRRRAGRKAICWNLCVYDAIGLIATLVLLFNKTLNPLGWGVAAIYLFFAAGFDYFLLPRKKAA